MSNASTTTDRQGLIGRLDAGEVVRLRSAVDPALCRRVAERAATWTVVEAEGVRCSSAPFHDKALATAIAGALSAMGLSAPSSLTLLRCAPDDHGLPAGEGIGFLLDLTDGRVIDGGLVMDRREPMTGWRPEAGALILFDAARPPLLTVMAPHAPGFRVAVLGQTS